MRRGDLKASPAGEPRYLSTNQVASALGVSVSTVKRWVDEGLVQAQRTIGGHRKLLLADVMRFVRASDLPRADLSHLLPKTQPVDLPDLDSIRDQLIDALQQPDAELVRDLLHGAYQRHYPMEALADHVIGPAMARIGHDWEMGTIEVFHEHRATQAIVTAIYELQAQLRAGAKGRPVAVGGALEGDHSILPALLANMVLLEGGWNAVNLGPHSPISAFRTALVDVKPRLIWLSVSHLEEPDPFLQDYATFYRQAEAMGVPVAVGGRALTEPIRSKMPYTTFGDGLGHLAAFAKMLHRGPTLPRRGRPARVR